MIEDQSVPAASQSHYEALTKPFILLIVVIAVLVPLAAAAPISLNRAERPAPPPVEVNVEDLPTLDEITLDALYEDPSGISISYPAGWVIVPIQAGSFGLANYPVESIQSDTIPSDFALIQFDTLPISVFTILPDGSAPADGTSAHALAEAYVAYLEGRVEVGSITDLTAGDAPAARFSLTYPGEAFGDGEIIVATLNNETMIHIQSSTTPINTANIESLTSNILDSIVWPVTDGS